MTEKLLLKNINFTSREIDILSLLAFNIRATKSIAYILEISPRTVDFFIHNIVKKMKFRSRKDVANFIINKKYDVFFKDKYEKLVYAKLKNSSQDIFDKNYIDLKADQEFESLSQVSQKIAFYDKRLKKIIQTFLWIVGVFIVCMFYIFLFER